MAHDTMCGMNILSKFQVPSSSGLGLRVFGRYPKLDTRISFIRSSVCPYITLLLPPLKSETGWTGELDFFWIIYGFFFGFFFGFFDFFWDFWIFFGSFRFVFNLWIFLNLNFFSSFFGRRAKKALAEGRSPQQELEVGPRSRPYLLVTFKTIQELLKQYFF